MKKFLIVTALFGFMAIPLTGCGGSGENKVIESSSSDDGSMSSDQQAQYEEQMRSYGSSQSSAPKASE